MQNQNDAELAAYLYLNNIEENWQLYKAIERNQTLYDQDTDNLVEQIFAWTLEDRFHSPYHYIKGNFSLF